MKSKIRKSTSNVTATLGSWATSLVMEPRTLQKRLLIAGHEITPREMIAARTIYSAIMGDAEAEKIRNLKADADRKEMENKEMMKELVRWSWVVETVSSSVILPLRQKITAIPSEYSSRCNQTNPTESRVGLEQLRDDIIKTLVNTLPK